MMSVRGYISQLLPAIVENPLCSPPPPQPSCVCSSGTISAEWQDDVYSRAACRMIIIIDNFPVDQPAEYLIASNIEKSYFYRRDSEKLTSGWGGVVDH